MSDSLSQPAFGTADLTNCERELIHLAGSIQPHGVLLVLDADTTHVLQASANVAALLGSSLDDVLGRPLADIAPAVGAAIAPLLPLATPERGQPLQCRLERPGESLELEGMLHLVPDQGVIVELEQVDPTAFAWAPGELSRHLPSVITQFAAAPSVERLCEVTAREVRALIGYDRVMVYRFDADGHGEVVAEARDESLEPFLGLHYPSSDIPQRARELYLRNRVRLLADTGYAAVPVVPRLSPRTGTDLDLSMSYLRSLSPIHIQYLRNMGVTGTLVTSLTKDGQLWGLIACHHYSPRRLPYELRAACELLSEVFSTRLAALDANAVAHSILTVPQLERQMVETASASGDWHEALFGVLRGLMATLGATGGALLYEGQVLTFGVVPSTEELSRLAAWIAEQSSGPVFHSAALTKREPAFARLVSVASGVLALRITPTRLDYLMWFRREQVQTVRWAGNPNKAVEGDDPDHLSPRRSFAVWTEQVRHTARQWTEQELAIAQLLQVSIFDTIQQVQGIRVLIVARQLASVSRMAERSGEPMVILDERDQVLILNQPLRRLLGVDHHAVDGLEALARHFLNPGALIDAVRRVRRVPHPWIGDLSLRAEGEVLSLAVRVDAVPSADGGILGTIIIFTDLTARLAAEAARTRLSHVLRGEDAGDQLTQLSGVAELDEMMEGVLANARAAVMSLSGPVAEAIQPATLRSIEALTRRAAEVARQMVLFASQRPQKP
jgi:PAS domain S-box-containing protein